MTFLSLVNLWHSRGRHIVWQDKTIFLVILNLVSFQTTEVALIAHVLDTSVYKKRQKTEKEKKEDKK